jgi:ribosomal protein S18 acetylase RimI-like enzyme
MTIRDAKPEDAAAIAQVHVASWRTTYPGIMPQEHLDALLVAEYEQMWWGRLRFAGLNKPLVSVAETEDRQLVGFVSGGAERSGDADYLGEIYALYLLHSLQRQGLGRKLVQTMARRLDAGGFQTLLIWVNAHNSACHFYEALGGIAARTGQREIKGVTYDDIGYGWDAVAFRRLIGL